MKFLFAFPIIVITCIKCENENLANESKQSLLYFRKQVEEIEDTTVKHTKRDDSHSNLVEFLVKNVREIFNDLPTTEISKEGNRVTRTMQSTSVVELDQSISTGEKISTALKLTNDVMLYENLTVTALLDTSNKPDDQIEELYGVTGRSQLLYPSKDLPLFEKSDKYARDVVPPILQKYLNRNSIEDTPQSNEGSEQKRSCIVCDNVNSDDCNDPENKLISSAVCERDDDLCYSQHTPFGIVDRGCFNINYNMSTYVCACNLCNYISISEMPYVFSNKRDWVDNVIELSRTRHFRKSVFKDMSCLRCEANVTTKRGDMLDSANCLEGNIGTLPIEECEDNEVCAVKVVHNDGYVWRGCVETPLYNYWWAICDSDLCNYDPLVSIYDHLN